MGEGKSWRTLWKLRLIIVLPPASLAPLRPAHFLSFFFFVHFFLFLKIQLSREHQEAFIFTLLQFFSH